MDPRYNGCHYKARRVFLGEEFEVRVFDVDDVGLAVVIHATAAGVGDGSAPLQFSRVFTRPELEAVGVHRTLEGYVTLVDSLELLEDAFFTAGDAAHAGLSELAAYQLSSSLPGIRLPGPIVSQHAATAYLNRAPVGLSTWNASRSPADDQLLLDVVAKGLAALCRKRPTGLDAVQWLGQWFLDHNPTQPQVTVEGE